ncbi:ABC-three component system middle component 7 [Dermabacteraceae bacterium P13138]
MPFNESTLAYFVPIMKALGNSTFQPSKLYTKIEKVNRPSLDEYVDALTCLFALGRIDLDEQTGMVHRAD